MQIDNLTAQYLYNWCRLSGFWSGVCIVIQQQPVSFPFQFMVSIQFDIYPVCACVCVDYDVW